ncbi:MAG TPA: aminoglycoside 6-adenylyltransferase [Ardenticatenaceae bacterium]|nr:aminoglycoside 6-adenylyltransferase [Ardenticatenaceae bacterium]
MSAASNGVSQAELDYTQLEQKVLAWAEALGDIRAAIVVGSRARLDHPADEWSDLDLILFTTDPAAYVTNTDWLAAIGEVWLAVLDQTGRGDPEWLVLFEGALKVDFVLAAVTDGDAGARPSVWQMMAASPYRRVFRRGVRVLFDKNAPGSQSSPPVPEQPPERHPSLEELTALVEHVLYDGVRAAKLLRRGDLWRAKRLCDCDLKQRLLSLIEWHARALYGLERDVWHGGCFLEEWANRQALAALPATFAAYDRDDLQRGLLATLELCRRLAMETAERLGYAYPSGSDGRIMSWVRTTLAE